MIEPRKQAPEMLAYPGGAERRFPFVAQLHARGKSIHLDLRLSKGDHLAGWTVAIQVPGAIKEPVTTLEAARKVARDAKAWKIDPATGEWATRRLPDGTERRTELTAFPKAAQPISWLDVEGVTKPGGIGATARFPGVFLVLDRGEISWGALKPSLFEFHVERSERGMFPPGRYFLRPLVLGRAEKHLGGEHDESSHGRRGGTIPPRPPDDADSATFRRMADERERAISREAVAGLKEGKSFHLPSMTRPVTFTHPENARIGTDGKLRLQVRRGQWVSLTGPTFESIARDLKLREEAPTEAAKRVVLPPSEEQDILGVTWAFIKPDSQLPNVLAESSRVERPWVPPRGWSALPSHLREKVSPGLQYWGKPSERERMKVRDALYERWKADDLIEELASGELEKCLMDAREWYYAGGVR